MGPWKGFSATGANRDFAVGTAGGPVGVACMF